MAETPDETANGTVEHEPEPPERQSSGFFRDRPSAFFAWLGAILFVGGWGVAIYIFFNAGEQFSGDAGSVAMTLRLQYLVSIGSSVTLAAGVLWGVAAYLWVQLLPVAEADAG